MPVNANKALEYGFENGAHPVRGHSVEPEQRLPTGSTLTEENGTLKTGSVAPSGINASIESLDRVRVDSVGQVLTTN